MSQDKKKFNSKEDLKHFLADEMAAGKELSQETILTDLQNLNLNDEEIEDFFDFLESEGAIFIDTIDEDEKEIELEEEDNINLDDITVDLQDLNLKNTMSISNDTRRKDGIKSYFNILGTSQILTQEQEVEYAKMLESEDEEERDFAFKQLFNSNLKLVVSVARRHLNRGLAFEDLIQEGNIGLGKAILKFNYHKGFKFSTYAT